jgi:peroxiredoxin
MVLLQSSMVPLGTQAPDFSLMGIDDKMHSLVDYDVAKVLVMIFMCNHCPYVQEIWDDLVALEESMSDEVQFIGVNSNANPNYPEDSFEKMKVYAEEKGQGFPYLYDEKQVVAKSYDAQCTPDFFVYDLSRELVYRGAFESLESAIEDLLNEKTPVEDQEVSMGCSIKWSN